MVLTAPDTAPAAVTAALAPWESYYVVTRGAAAALTGGTAALVRSLHPAMKAPAVAAILELSADHPAATLPSPTQGWGQVDPYAALVRPPNETAAPSAPRGTAIAAFTLAPPDDPSHRFTAVAVSLAVLVTAALLTGALAAVRIAVRRGWRAGAPASHT